MASTVSCCTFAVLILSCAVISCNAAAGDDDMVTRDAKLFNVMDFDAKPGTKEDNSQAFIQAWRAACDFNGKSMLLVPPGNFLLGETIFQGPCKGPAPMIFKLEGTLKALDDLSAYPDKGWISFDQINGLLLTGRGTIDGQGQNFWKYNDCHENPNCSKLPASLYMTKVINGNINTIRLINSMGFHMHVTHCERILIRGIGITAPPDSPNTDGIHISASLDVKVTRSSIQTGDDCISAGQGSTNVTITKIKCGPGHGISVGSLGKRPDELDVRGLLVKNCTLTRTTNGVRIKTYADSDPSKASEIVFADITMEDVKNPIIIDQNYGPDSSKPSLVEIRDVLYQNIRGTTTSPVAVNLMCGSGETCSNIRLQDINLKLKGKGIISSACTHVDVGYIGIQIPPPCRK